MCTGQEAQQRILASACDVLGQFFGCRRLSKCRSLVLSGARPVCLSVCEVPPFLMALGKLKYPSFHLGCQICQSPPSSRRPLFARDPPNSTNVPSEAAQTLVPRVTPWNACTFKEHTCAYVQTRLRLRERAGQTRDITAV